MGKFQAEYSTIAYSSSERTVTNYESRNKKSPAMKITGLLHLTDSFSQNLPEGKGQTCFIPWILVSKHRILFCCTSAPSFRKHLITNQNFIPL